MSEVFNKGMARNIYYGGSLFFVLVFLGLTWHTERRLPQLDNRSAINEQAVLGKRLWEENNCIGCHTLHGEGAYFAPELGNVYTRFGESTQAIEVFISSRPKEGVNGRRSMPQFNFAEEELKAIAEFLKYADGIDTANWPPNIQG